MASEGLGGVCLLGLAQAFYIAIWICFNTETQRRPAEIPLIFATSG